jgi:hypothetical protein
MAPNIMDEDDADNGDDDTLEDASDVENELEEEDTEELTAEVPPLEHANYVEIELEED